MARARGGPDLGSQPQRCSSKDGVLFLVRSESESDNEQGKMHVPVHLSGPWEIRWFFWFEKAFSTAATALEVAQ